MNKESENKKKKYIIYLLLFLLLMTIFIFILENNNIKPSPTKPIYITPSYKLASTPYATLVFIGNGTAKVGGIEGIKYLTKNNTIISMNVIDFPFNNITIDNKTFAFVDENFSYAGVQKINISSYASKNGTLYYIRLINFSNYYGVIIPANFMNNSNITLPFTINPYPSVCYELLEYLNKNETMFNKGFDYEVDFKIGNGVPSLKYAYTAIEVEKYKTLFINNSRYNKCNVSVYWENGNPYVVYVNNNTYNYTFVNTFLNKLFTEFDFNLVYPHNYGLSETFIGNKNGTITRIDLPVIYKFRFYIINNVISSK